MALLHKLLFFLAMLLLPLQMLLFPVMSASDCPLDLSESNFTLGASICSSKEDRGKCCRYINAIIAASVARYAAATGDLGVGSNSSEICLHSISETLDLYGVTRNATAFCGLGTKILVNYECMDLSTTNQMLQSPKFGDVMENCKPPLKADNDCRTCLNSGIIYLRNLIGAADNTTLSTCRDATFVALASQVDNASSIDIAGCFFGVQGLLTASVAGSSPLLPAPPQVSPSPYVAAGPSQLSLSTPIKENHRSYRLTLLPGVGIAVAAMASIMMAILSVLICMKRKELEDSDNNTKQERSTEFHQPAKKLQDGPSNMFRKFSYKETKNATRNFSVVIGEGGFGTVYKAEFDGTLVAAVKKMNKISEQAEDEFCKEIELLARLYHRHLVALRGFCIRKKDRFLIYEYMANGSLKDQLHGAGMALSWRTRIQIAIDVANALEYLHFYCNPPLCHRDIKSSNILLDENFIAKVADFGLAHASKDGSVCFEPVNTDIKGTPGYMDPEYVVTQELTEKSDVYSYGVVLLELVTGRMVIQNNKNLVEWSQIYLTSEEESMITELVDSRIGESYDFDQLEAIVGIINWCTQKEGRARPSIKQVLRLLYECTDPVHSIFGEEDEDDFEGGKGRMSGGGRSRRSNGGGGDGRLLGSSSSTTRSYCSRSFLLETGSPTQSPINLPST